MSRGERNQSGGGTLDTHGSLNAAIKGVCDKLRRSNCAGALQYVPELTWLLFLCLLDRREANEAEEARAVGASYRPSLSAPYRWQDWAAPGGAERVRLQNGKLGDMFGFVNGTLLPHLRALLTRPSAMPRQKVIGEIVSGVERTRVDTETNLLDVLDGIDAIGARATSDTHVFPVSHAYEGLLLKMGEKGNDGGQFFTPREIMRAMVRVVNPKPGETVYDPCCGTGGFLAQAMIHMQGELGDDATPDLLETLQGRTFYGREKENLIYPIALANLVLHGIDEPHVWHGNTLTGAEAYGGLFQDAPALHDAVLTNPPFGGKEGIEAQARFAYKTSATQVLFLQHVVDSLKPGGRCGMVLDEGVLYRTNEQAFVKTKRKLLDSCDLWCVVSLPPGLFTAAGAGVKTNLAFFTRGRRTERTWYYDLSDLKIGKRTPFTLAQMEDFFRLLPDRADSARSWTVTRAEQEARGLDLKAVNPTRKAAGDTRTPAELLDTIETHGAEVAAALAELRGLLVTEP